MESYSFPPFQRERIALFRRHTEEVMPKPSDWPANLNLGYSKELFPSFFIDSFHRYTGSLLQVTDFFYWASQDSRRLKLLSICMHFSERGCWKRMWSSFASSHSKYCLSILILILTQHNRNRNLNSQIWNEIQLTAEGVEHIDSDRISKYSFGEHFVFSYWQIKLRNKVVIGSTRANPKKIP